MEDGTFVLNLDWDIAPGVGYGLRCSSDDPQLWREGTDSALDYPYAVGDLLTVTNSTAGPSLSYYYFFYAWTAEPLPVECATSRFGSTVTVEGTSLVEGESGQDWAVGPNPVVQGESIRFSGMDVGSPIEVLDAQGRVVYTGQVAGNILADWPAGWYSVRVMSQGQFERQTLVVR